MPSTAWRGSGATSRRGEVRARSSPTSAGAPSRTPWRRRFARWAPQLEDLNLRQRIKVKCYDKMLTDMNARHFARMEADDLAAFNRVFEGHEDALRHFGYELMA